MSEIKASTKKDFIQVKSHFSDEIVNLYDKNVSYAPKMDKTVGQPTRLGIDDLGNFVPLKNQTPVISVTATETPTKKPNKKRVKSNMPATIPNTATRPAEEADSIPFGAASASSPIEEEPDDTTAEELIELHLRARANRDSSNRVRVTGTFGTMQCSYVRVLVSSKFVTLVCAPLADNLYIPPTTNVPFTITYGGVDYSVVNPGVTIEDLDLNYIILFIV